MLRFFSFLIKFFIFATLYTTLLDSRLGRILVVTFKMFFEGTVPLQYSAAMEAFVVLILETMDSLEMLPVVKRIFIDIVASKTNLRFLMLTGVFYKEWEIKL